MPDPVDRRSDGYEQLLLFSERLEPIDLVPSYINDHRLADADFSKRERDVTYGLCLGLNDCQQGVRWGISQRTVTTYIERAIAKANRVDVTVSCRAALIGWAQMVDRPEEHGLRLVV